MIFIIDDDEIMAGCMSRAANTSVRIFKDAISAMSAISEGGLPSLIFLDILLDGPDGFTFLNELISYPDTAKIPVVIVSSLDFPKQGIGSYKIAGVLNKDTMKPADIRSYVRKYAE